MRIQVFTAYGASQPVSSSPYLQGILLSKCPLCHRHTETALKRRLGT